MMKDLVIVTIAISCLINCSYGKLGVFLQKAEPIPPATLKCLAGLGVVNIMYVTASQGQ
jgi:hypothetical protein